MMKNEGFVTVREAAAILDVSPNTVRSWGSAGKITEYRHPINDYRMYKRNELERLVEEANRPITPPKVASKRKPR